MEIASTIGPLKEVNIDNGTFWDLFELGGLFDFAAQKGDWRYTYSFAYFRLGDEDDNLTVSRGVGTHPGTGDPFLTATLSNIDYDAHVSHWYNALTVGYIINNDLDFEVFTGVRHDQIELDVELTATLTTDPALPMTPFALDFDQNEGVDLFSWMVGFSFKAPISDNWSFGFKGSGSYGDEVYSFEANAGFYWALSESWQVFSTYKYGYILFDELDEPALDGDLEYFEETATGVTVGVTFSF